MTFRRYAFAASLCVLLPACSSNKSSDSPAPKPATSTSTAGDATKGTTPTGTAPATTTGAPTTPGTSSSVPADPNAPNQPATVPPGGTTTGQTGTTNPPPATGGTTGGAVFLGSCSYGTKGNVTDCDDVTGTGNYDLSKECVSQDPNWTLTYSKDHCPTANVRETCPAFSDTDQGITFSTVTRIYSAADASETCAALASPPPQTGTGTGTGNGP